MPMVSHSPKVGPVPPPVSRERLTEVSLNNNQDRAMLVREVSPKGEIVVHAVKKSAYVHDRLHDLGRIDNELYDAAERFRKDFERALLSGRFSSIDLFRSSGGTAGDISDKTAEARVRVKEALLSLGARKGGKSITQSCLWFVVGCGNTLEQWSIRMRNGGENMSESKASGVLCALLEPLAVHYGLVNTRTLKERAASHAYHRGRTDMMQEVLTLAQLSAVGTAKEALQQFGEMLKNKVAKYKSAG